MSSTGRFIASCSGAIICRRTLLAIAALARPGYVDYAPVRLNLGWWSSRNAPETLQRRSRDAVEALSSWGLDAGRLAGLRSVPGGFRGVLGDVVGLPLRLQT